MWNLGFDIFFNLFQTDIEAYERDAITFCVQHHGHYFKHNNIYQTFYLPAYRETQGYRPAIVPMDKTYYSLVKRFRHLDKRRQVIKCFVSSTQPYLFALNKILGRSPEDKSTLDMLLPEEIMNIIGASLVNEAHLAEEIIAIRHKFRKEQFNKEVRSLLIEVQLLRI